LLPRLVHLWGGAVRHSGDQYVSVFHKYSLGGDITALSGLYARLCHAFLVYVFFIHSIIYLFNSGSEAHTTTKYALAIDSGRQNVRFFPGNF